MLYIYQADVWCESCGEALRAELTPPPGADLSDERTYDSDDYPKGPFPPEATDTPEHCAAGPECLEWVDLADYARSDWERTNLYGAMPDGLRYVGAILNDELTPDGCQYTRELVDPTDPRKRALHRLWSEVYGLDL